MDIEAMKYYGLTKMLDRADYFETEQYQVMLTNLKLAIENGGIIALTGIVGIGKTVTLRRMLETIRSEGQVLVCKSLATDKRQVSANTLYTALFSDLLAGKKDTSFPMQAEKRERKLQALIKEQKRSVALFIDEAHDLNHRTLISLKRLIEIVQDVRGTLAVVLVGHPKLANDLQHPILEEIGARAHRFELRNLGINSHRYIEWILKNCSPSGTKPDSILTVEAMEHLAQRLITPLQITYYLSRALEKGFQIGEKPVSEETIKTILSPDLEALEPNLARHGYNMTILCDYLNARKHEVKAYLRGQLPAAKAEEFNKQIHRLGAVL